MSIIPGGMGGGGGGSGSPGPKGDPGVSIAAKGWVSSFQELPAPTTLNDMWVINNKGNVSHGNAFVCDGTTWVSIGNLLGPTGLTGPAGPAAPVVDNFLLDVFTWTGSQTINNGVFQNFGALNLLASAANTAGVTRVGNLLFFPAIAKHSGVTIRTRITGTIGGSSGTAREWFVQTRRADGTTVVGSRSCVKVTGTPITNRDAVLTSYTLNATDPFTTQGIMVGLDNQSTQTITITSIELLIQRFVNP